MNSNEHDTHCQPTTTSESLEHEDLVCLHELSHELLFILDRDGRFRYMSNAAREFLGFDPRAEAPDRVFLDGITPKEREHVARRLAELERDSIPVDFDAAHITRSGTYRRFQWTLRRTGARIHGVARPVRTAFRAAEEGARADTDATAAGSGAPLIDDAAGHAKTEFLASMNHELRTPLNAILGYTELLAGENGLSSRHREALDAIKRSSQHLLLLINDILDFAKLDAGKLTLKPRDCALASFLRMLTELFESRAREKRISFIYQETSELPAAIRVDETRLRQVLLNLLGNAVKFTRRGGVTLRTGFTDDRLHFEVVDTGIGIPESHLEAIFRPFEQIPQDRAFVEGTGLGLSISRRLVDLMGGNLRVESRFGEGSRFSFDIQPMVVQRSTQAHSDAAIEVPLARDDEVVEVERDPEATGDSESAFIPETSSFTLEQLRAIHDAATIGDIRAILRVLEEAGGDADSAHLMDDPLAAELHALAKAFRSRQIKERIKVLLG